MTLKSKSPPSDQPAIRQDALDTLRKRLLDPSLPEAAIAPLESAINKIEYRSGRRA
mgnify:CR=1 FL=1